MEHYPFSLMKLPYSYDALEPYIDQETVTIHHDGHLKTYVDNLNKALASYPQYQNWTLERLLTNVGALPPEIQTAVKNNGGGVYNHNLYFNTLAPAGQTEPHGELLEAINATYGSLQEFYKMMKENALSVFGSGYSFLVMDQHENRQKGLRIINTPNQDTPLPYGMCPILPLDVWEHAYYLKHQNKRADYIDDWAAVINWDQALENYKLC